MLQRSILLGLTITAALASSPAFSINPGTGWEDSYSVGDQCYCVTTFDHGAGVIEVDTPAGVKTVEEICDIIGPGPGVGNNPIYNDVQCGNGPANDAIDEVLCPGRVDLGADGCSIIGPTWNLDNYFTAPDSTSGGAIDETEESEQPPVGILFEAETAVTADSRWFESTIDTPQQDSSSDPDANHSLSAGNSTYLELLPDTLVTASDAVTTDNQWNEPGFGPILQYEIDIPEAGVYAIAVRGYASGDYDRRIHAGVDGLWTSTSDNITLCETNRWSWSNCNDANDTVEFASAGIHQLMFSAAEDGFELDQFVLTPIAIEANSNETDTDTDTDTDTESETETEPELAEAISVGEGVAFGASLTYSFLFLVGLILLLRRRTSQQ